MKLSRDVWSGSDNSTGIPDHHDDDDDDDDDNGNVDDGDIFYLDSTSWTKYPVSVKIEIRLGCSSGVKYTLREVQSSSCTPMIVGNSK